MLRRLLALLALITGIAATGAPVHAAKVEAIAGRVEAGCELAGQGAEMHAISAISEARGIIRVERREFPVAEEEAGLFAPAARIGADRALE